ncbi:hypothetical protein BY458DRAFT_546223 [Sporodiniella umbellata]|nr:hypothetical protein BY458DRAFT_546223 [Sporodiniella umbellata]
MSKGKIRRTIRKRSIKKRNPGLEYVGQRAAQTILSETSTRQISTDGLQAINSFLDEFIDLVIFSSGGDDLERIKTSVQCQVPNSVGQRALLEAESELSRLLETESGLPERIPGDLDSLQQACADHSTLSSAYRKKREPVNTIVCFVTAIVEHLAEYLLLSLARHARTELLRTKQVLSGLAQDIHLSHLFHRMKLKDQLQKKTLVYSNLVINDQKESIELAQKSFEIKRAKRKFSFFKTKSHQGTLTLSSPLAPLATNFEALFLSGETKKVTLTPERLRSIEVPSKEPLPETRYTRPWDKEKEKHYASWLSSH